MDNDYKILTVLDKEFLKSNTPYVLPNEPTNSGWTAEQIKEKMYTGHLILFEWLRNTQLYIENNYAPSTETLTYLKNQLNDLEQRIVDGDYVLPEGYTLDYPQLKNKPSINDVELVGNITLEDLGLREISDLELSAIIGE